jgi:hypothetical protein
MDLKHEYYFSLLQQVLTQLENRKTNLMLCQRSLPFQVGRNPPKSQNRQVTLMPMFVSPCLTRYVVLGLRWTALLDDSLAFEGAPLLEIMHIEVACMS